MRKREGDEPGSRFWSSIDLLMLVLVGSLIVSAVVIGLGVYIWLLLKAYTGK